MKQPDCRGDVEKRLLIVDDEENMRHMLRALLGRFGYRIDAAADGEKALECVKANCYDFILCDLKMPQMSGMEFLRTARDDLQETTVIVMSAYGGIDTAIEAMKEGAYDYISKPFKTDEVYLALKKAEERESLRRENNRLRERLRDIEKSFSFARMVGKSSPMQEVFRMAAKAAQFSATILIFGESGTGKELIARGIHFYGDRADKPFIPVNCGGIPENLMESEFFGFKRGAFTGAGINKKGLFEEADGGTIFLDEIGEIPLSLQVKFLRVLQESEVRPIGEAEARKIDFRVVAATSKNLEEEVKEGRFRRDLFYRLNVFPITLPPLRERTGDVPLLIRHFISRYNKVLDKRVKGVTPEGMALLLRHDWPGNVRELENAVERALILAEGDMLNRESFPFLSASEPASETDGASGGIEGDYDGFSLKEAQKHLEKRLIIKALSATGGNRTRATQLLEISHPSLLSKMKAYEIDM